MSYWPVDATETLHIDLSYLKGRQTAHCRTRLADGREGLLVDCGAIGNLVGAQTENRLKKGAESQGLPVTYRQMDRPLTVEGVGKTAQRADNMSRIPITTPTGGLGVYEAPVVPESNVPALLGLNTMEKQRVILDIPNQKYIIPGEGDVKILLPAGSQVLSMEKAPCGRLLLPCDEWQG